MVMMRFLEMDCDAQMPWVLAAGICDATMVISGSKYVTD